MVNFDEALHFEEKYVNVSDDLGGETRCRISRIFNSRLDRKIKKVLKRERLFFNKLKKEQVVMQEKLISFISIPGNRCC